MIHRWFSRRHSTAAASKPPAPPKQPNASYATKAQLDACQDPSFSRMACMLAASDWTFSDYAKVHDAQLWRKSTTPIGFGLYLLGRRDAFLGRSCMPPRVYQSLEEHNSNALQSFGWGYQDGVLDLLFGTQRVPAEILRAFPDYQDPVLSNHDRMELLKTSLFARP